MRKTKGIKHLKPIHVIKKEPLVVLSVLGILIGSFLYFLKMPTLAHIAWQTVLFLGGSFIVFQTVKGMLSFEFASDIVAMLAIVVAIILDQAFAGSIVVLMQSGGEAIERYGFRKATFSLEELLKRAPRKARKKVKTSESFVEVDVNLVEIDDFILIRPGELVPVDCQIIEGKTFIDDSAITGEPFEKQCQEGAVLLSGSVNITGAITAKALRLSKDSQYNKIVDLVQKAQLEKAPIQRLADRYAIIFTPLTLIMAFLGLMITGNWLTVLSVLVVATPCPLILATPLAVICAINRAAKEGIIVKGGAPIEEVAKSQAILFDKTGTITTGNPTIEKILTFNATSKAEILQVAASLEQFSTHSVAKAIVLEAKQKQLSLKLPEQFQEIPGKGVKGNIDSSPILVGSYDLIINNPPQNFKQEDFIEFSHPIEENSLIVFVVKSEICLGAIILKDKIRSNAKQTLLDLQKMGMKEISMVTGDHLTSAQSIANTVGIKKVFANLLPQDKVIAVKQLQKQYQNVIMVGDGINDAPALATANVGIAMGAHGTAISAEAANIVLLVDDLSKIVKTITIGKRMLFIAKQSIFIGIGLSFILMVFACFGYIIPAIGAMLQEVIDVAVILNALRVLQTKKS